MNRIIDRIIALLLAVFLLVYVGYQMYTYYYNPLQMEAALDYMVEQSLLVDGIAVRRESVIDQRGSGGVETSVLGDGERVAVGQAVVEYYSNSAGDGQVQRMRELEKEIAALQEAQNPVTSNFSNAESYTRNIREQISSITGMSSTGRFQNVDEIRSSLTGLLNKKQVSIGKEKDYQARISTLQSEYDRLAGGVAVSSADVVTSPLAGYFIGSVDGLENLSLDKLDDYTIADYRDLIEGEKVVPTNTKVGKIITESNWYYAALVSQYDVQWMQAGHDVAVQFHEVDAPVPGVVENILFENNEEEAILLIRINRVSGELLKLRHASATIKVEQYSGLRISSSSLRYQDGVQGVYVLLKRTVRFKRIEPIYEEAGFVISAVNADSDFVQQYDQIITKGMDLYDGKVIE